MKLSADFLPPDQILDRRARARSRELTHPMVVISLSGSPLYQLKVRDLSDQGAGIVVRADSNLIQKIEAGQELKVRVVLPRGYQGPSGHFLSRVEHITELQEGPFNGHMIVGLSFIAPASEQELMPRAKTAADPIFNLD